MGAPDSALAIDGYLPAQLIAHSYLGGLWVALDQRQGAPGRPVLLRRLQLQEHIPAEALQRMACAARDAMALSHENVLSVVAVLQQAESLAVAYEYVEAEPLRSLQASSVQRSLRFPVAVSLRIVVDLARGIKALHGTLAGWPSAPPFGGVSPDSVLVARDGRTRICDALTASCATLLEGLGLNVGKLAYTAPEQAYATAPLAPTADVFSCGVLLWELLAGTRLLTGSRPTVERKLLEHDWPHLGTQLAGQTIAPALLKLVDRCLSSDADRRPATPAALANELEQCGEELAQLPEVARFIAELAAPRFDQRKLAVRSSLLLPAQVAPASSLPLATPLSAPAAAATAVLPLAATATPSLTAMVRAAAQLPAPAAAQPQAAQPSAPSLPAAARLSGALRIPLPAQLSSLSPRSSTSSAALPSAALPSAAAPARVSLPSTASGVSLGRIPLLRTSVPRPRNSQLNLRAVSQQAPARSSIPQPSPALVPVAREGGSVASGPPATSGAPAAREPSSAPTPTPAAPSAAPPVAITAADYAAARRAAAQRAAGQHAAPGRVRAASQPPPSEAPATERNSELLAATSSPPGRALSFPPDSGWSSPAGALTPGPLGAPAVAADADAPLSQEAVVIPEARAIAVGTPTLMGIPIPPPVLLPNLPFASWPPRGRSSDRGSSPAVVVIPPESQDSSRPRAATSSSPPQPFTSLVPTLAPPAFSEPPSSATSAPPATRRDSGWSHPPSEPRFARGQRRRSWLARAGATLALGAALMTVLWVRDAGHDSSFGAASATVLSTAQLPPLPMARPTSKHEPAAPTSALAVATAPSTALVARQATGNATSEAARQLRDEQLLELFALEQRSALPECAERRPPARLPASRARQKSQTQLKAAQRELTRGNPKSAQQWLCSALSIHPGNSAAWLTLAELALQRGDGAHAQRSLTQALKSKPNDPKLLAALGDAEALLGNLQQSRTLWTRSAPPSEHDTQPHQRLAARFDALGASALGSSSFGAALAHYRRAVVLSAGASAPSAGMARSLRGLNQPLAAEPWEQRATALRR